ncbi:MAG: helix-hairpin-helix domain-containing protein [Saprospiraceae bacterium]
METELKHKTLIELQKIPSIGKACALDLWNIGIRKHSDLKDKNPLELYLRLNEITGQTHDICMLYTFRCAVYFASEKTHEAQKLNWWYWKDKKYNE